MAEKVKTACKCGCGRTVQCPPDAVAVAYKSMSHARKALSKREK